MAKIGQYLGSFSKGLYKCFQNGIFIFINCTPSSLKRAQLNANSPKIGRDMVCTENITFRETPCMYCHSSDAYPGSVSS